ncbi:MAG: SRPBCC domain-containing protein [Chitinophagaceae bacterium]
MITAQVIINAGIEKVWKAWTNAEHIVQWNNPSTAWQTTTATADVKTGGNFLFKMEAKDGSDKFDYTGIYDLVIPHQKIMLTQDDGRKTTNLFAIAGNSVTITETFEPTPGIPDAEQKAFCQSVLDNFKNYVETIMH